MDSSRRIRQFLLAILVVGLVGTEIELLLLGHYEDSWQLVPLLFVAAALVAIVCHVMFGGAGSIAVLRGVMGFLIVAGAIGVFLHYRGNLEFQLEIDANQSRWDLFTKAMRAKAPPALAPGILAQLGVLGLIYTYKHPALVKPELVKDREATS